MTGSLWERREQYIANSPLYYLDRVQTPLLILNGEEDYTASVEQNERIYWGLKALGKAVVEHHQYAGEGHALAEPANMMESLATTLRWFDTYLQPQQPRIVRN